MKRWIANIKDEKRTYNPVNKNKPKINSKEPLTITSIFVDIIEDKKIGTKPTQSEELKS